MTRFFVPSPNGALVDEEQVYEALARVAGHAPLPPDQRVESITWKHDAEVWTATVGSRLRGQRRRRARRGGRMQEVTDHLSDPATVLAIFPGHPGHPGLPALVVTDAARGSEWANPFMAGNPTITYFDPPAPV